MEGNGDLTVSSLGMVMFLLLARVFRTIPDWRGLPTETKFKDGKVHTTELPPRHIPYK